MSDSARLRGVVDEGTARESELVVECDRCCEAAESCEDSFSEALEGAGAVSFEGEEVFAGPEDRLDPLADRREVRAVAGFVAAAGAQDRGIELLDSGEEFAASVVLIADHDLTAATLGAVQEGERDLFLVDLWGAELLSPRRWRQ